MKPRPHAAARAQPPTWEALRDWLERMHSGALDLVDPLDPLDPLDPTTGVAREASANAVPEITVSMPARNTATTIGVALRSVLAQEGPPLEVVVVDDASHDGTAEVAEALGDPRVEVVRLERAGGIGAAHNLVTGRARGRFIVHVDSDDIVLPGGIEGAVAPLRARAELAQTFSDFFDLGADGTIDEGAYRNQLRRFDRRYASGIDVGRELLVHGMVANHLRAYRRSVLVDVGGFGETMDHGEDWAMAVVLASRYEIAPTGAWLYARRVRATSISGGAHMTPLRFWWDHLPILRRLLRDQDGRLCGFGTGEVVALNVMRGVYATGVVDQFKRWTRTGRR